MEFTIKLMEAKYISYPFCEQKEIVSFKGKEFNLYYLLLFLQYDYLVFWVQQPRKKLE